jgi:hypothetical protein
MAGEIDDNSSMENTLIIVNLITIACLITSMIIMKFTPKGKNWCLIISSKWLGIGSLPFSPWPPWRSPSFGVLTMHDLLPYLIATPFALVLAWLMGRGKTSPKPKKITLFLWSGLPFSPPLV